MSLLILGLVLWTVVHLFPSVASTKRELAINKIGLGPYKGVFALLIISSVVLIVFGWRSINPENIYLPAEWSRHITFPLVLLTFILFAAAKGKTNIKRFLRHPQLSGLVLWSIGHLLSNGENRSVLLFTWLGIWAILEITMINRREGEWNKPGKVPIKSDVITVVVGCVIFSVLFVLHPYITGVALKN